MKHALLTALLVCLVPGAFASTVRVDNNTGGWDIYEVYVTPAGSDSWGDDLLGSDIIASGETGEFQVDPGHYDIMLVDEDGDMYEKFSVNILFRHVWKVTLDDLTRYESGATYSGGG
jgi:hypothetical protein